MIQETIFEDGVTVEGEFIAPPQRVSLRILNTPDGKFILEPVNGLQYRVTVEQDVVLNGGLAGNNLLVYGVNPPPETE